jgi:LysM repeat protein
MAGIALFISAAIGTGGNEAPIAQVVPEAPTEQAITWASLRHFSQLDEPAPPVVEAATAPPPPAPTPEPWASMVVREGDTFNSLAEWFGLTGADIAAANGVGLDYLLHPGETLAIPVLASQFVMPPEVPVYVYEEPVPEETPVYEEPVVVLTPAPTPPPVARVASQSDVVAAICSLPWPCDTMVRIATCESGLNPNSYNPAGYYGIFQIAGIFDGWNDPWVNARVAYEQKYLPALAGGNGLSPWPHCQYY